MDYNPRFGSRTSTPTNDMLDVYKRGISGGPVQGTDSRRTSNMRRGSMMKDPVAVHLLVETAKADSQDFEILSFEELEALKKEQQLLSTRIDSVRRKLALETKVRDAAQSLNRLFTSKRRSSVTKRRSITSRSSLESGKSESLVKSGDELAVSMKKCEDLAKQLQQLEARAQEVQMRILMHTAGILQLTHDEKTGGTSAPPSGPSSPNRTFALPRGKTPQLPSIDDAFDDRSLYRSPENVDRFVTKPSLELQNQILLSVERRLEDLNERIREVVVQGSPEWKATYPDPHVVSPDAEETNRVACVDRQLDYLDTGLDNIEQQQKVFLAQKKNNTPMLEKRLFDINSQLCSLLDTSNPDQIAYPQPPATTGGGAEDQINYLEQCLYSIGQLHESVLQSATSSQSKSLECQALASQYEVVLTGLWSIILAGEEEARQRKRDRRQAIMADPSAGTLDDLSPDEDGDNADEPFTLQGFSAKVQWLYSRAVNLKEQQGILRRQIKQQRELNTKSDASRDSELSNLQEELEHARRVQNEAEEARHITEAKIDELQAQIADLQDDARIANAEIEARLSQSKNQVDTLTTQLNVLGNAKETAEKDAQAKTAALEAKEKELRELETDVVRLTTEVTFARAELDGAYGSRAQRAAEVAKNPELQKQLDDLATQNMDLLNDIAALKKEQSDAAHHASNNVEKERHLRSELEEMTREYEELTRDAIAYEKERERFEEAIDRLREAKERLELDLSDEKVRWLGIRSPSVVSGQMVGPEQTSIRMLRDDFRKMMREKTAEGLKALRAEQEERRKLEALVRSLRKEHGSGKSALSQSMTPI